ncbi:glycerophosphodiester phosphodiesterase, partial [Pseudomonas sp. MDMC224]
METRLLLGHRGAPRLARENTIESFALALQSGLDGVELDVQRSRDGVLVIHHDFDLGGVPIAELDWAELRRRAPWMPRLEEVFEFFEAHPKAWINLELKSQPPLSDGREKA